MIPRKRVLAVPLLMVCLGAMPWRAHAQGQPAPPAYDVEAEDMLFRSLNQARQENGLPALERDERLREAARAHSALMAQSLKLRHQLDGEPVLSQRLAGTGLRFDRDAENVAFGETAEDTHAGFMRSPGHRANILSTENNAVGIGVVRRGSLVWVTQDFAHRLRLLTDEQAESLAAEAFTGLQKLPPVRRLDLPQLRSMACDMAKSGKLDTSKVLGLRDVHYALAFTTAEPGDLPANVRKLRAQGAVERFAMGACFAVSPEYPGGMFWMLMAAY